MALTALLTLTEKAELAGGKEGNANFGPTAAVAALTTIATIDVREYDELSMILKNTDGADSLDYYVEGAVKDVPDDAADIDWAPITEKGEATEITNIALAFGVKEFLQFDVKNLSYVRVRVERTAASDAEITGSVKAVRYRP